jgi:PGF-pre-PGF domain-containing protein
MKKGETYTLLITDTDLPYLRELSITAGRDTYAARVSISDVEKKPYGTQDPAGEVYTYFKVKYNKPANYVETARMTFRVKKSWLEEKDMDPSSVRLQRHTQDWDELETEKIKDDELWYYFQAETPGFSYFTITGQGGSGYEEKEPVPEPVATPETIKPMDTGPPVETPVTREEMPKAPATPTETQKNKGICGPTSVILLAPLLSLISRRRTGR